MGKDEIKSKLATFMWHIGRFLTELMLVSDSTSSPIIVETFNAGIELFDTFGEVIYGSLSSNEIFPKLNNFIKSLDYKSKTSFDSVLDYAHEFSKDLLAFLEENKF
ncbi:MAG: hypothetical protein ACXAES_04985 [Promethearchaeota archaeon]|jgi:hypothetical protein